MTPADRAARLRAEFERRSNESRDELRRQVRRSMSPRGTNGIPQPPGARRWDASRRAARTRQWI
jgi:hypothetical protein